MSHDPLTGQESSGGLTVKIPLIPEEGTAGEWTVDPARFAEGAHPIALSGPVSLAGSLYKAGSAVNFQGRMAATLALECSRCLAPFTLPVEGEVNTVFLPAEEEGVKAEEPDAESIDAQLYEGDEIDLFIPLRDQVALAIPMRPLCREDCKGLCPRCGANLNEKSCACVTPTGDPRLAALKKFIR